MLKRADQKFQQETARSNSLSQTLFSSSPPKSGSQTTIPGASQFTNPGYRNPLKPATASALNGLNRVPPRQNLASGIKRTASGLAKLNGSFEDSMGSLHRPIEVVDFDENAFDSDVDLDIEEVKPKSTVAYPKLPSQPRTTGPPQPVAYPTLAKQQPVQAAPSTDNFVTSSSYASRSKLSAGQTPNSSADIPWSSSPVEHFAPSRRPADLRQYAHRPTQVEQAKQNGPPPPAKKRKIPWETRQDTTQEAPVASVQGRPQATPARKEDKSAAFWNTTASAKRDQQKRFRDENRHSNLSRDVPEEVSVQTKAKTSMSRPARVFLSEEQQHVLNLVTEEKKSVFFTGSAGTGKSVLLREIISHLRKKYQKEPDRVAVTASTGLAACNVGGVTLHSFAGIGLGKEEAPELVKRIKKSQKARHRWMRTKVLIVDEVSMVDADLFDKLEAVARILRNNGRPFGGIQLVITGDFFQLPPVPDYGKVAKFAFDAATWSTTIEHTIGLHQVFRQKDPVFAGMLNEMREGRLSESSVKAFRNLSRPLNFQDTLEATELFPTRNEVERANSNRLSMLQGEHYVFEARDGGAIIDKAQRDKLLSNCMAPEVITLKKGSQVMLIKNVDEMLVNGSIGRVVGFMSEENFDRYTASDLDEVASGDVPEAVLMEQNNRNKSLITTARRFPMVRFVIADGTSRDLLCQPESWKVELPNGEVQASRSQIPLILAWALSIHKAQGQTLDRVKVDLGKVFEKGQAYVALSRATSMAGLQVLRFDPKKVQAHDRVRNFYSNLSRVELAAKASGGAKKSNARDTTAARDYEAQFLNDDWPDMM